MLQTIRKSLALLSDSERRKSYYLLLMIVVMALMEVMGVASLMPFMVVLANPDIVKENSYFAAVYEYFSFSNINELLYFLGVIVFVALVSSILFRALTQYSLLRFTNGCTYSLSMRLLSSYLRQPYEWFLESHSADLSKTILAETGQVVNGTIVPLMQIIAQSAVAISLLTLLVIANPTLAISVAVGLGTVYTLIYLSLRGYLSFIGEDRQNANRERFKAIHEIFGGIKDVKVSGLENIMRHRFEEPAQRFRKREAASQMAGQLPRYALEAIAFGGMLIVILYLMQDEKGLKSALPIMTLYAFAAYRLMPALQQIYTMMSQLRYGSAALNALSETINALPTYTHGDALQENEQSQRMSLSDKLRLTDVSYTYPKSENPALNTLSLTIPARTTVAFVGKTGSGKSTTVDVILGLLRPQTGSVIVDDVEISEGNLRQWQNAVGYVPQHIYLSDDTLQANIAFGVPAEKVDQDAVEQASRIANLHEFVVRDMPDGYMTRVGERGVRLSGGQRQRIGIARALYHNPEILILDEATSALDNITEQAVMEAVHNLGHKKTIILIAHRLSTVRDCDEIFLMDRGKLVASGNYDQLVESNDTFRSMTAQNA